MDERTPHRTPSPSGRMLGPFELLGELGRGGMGVVYHARDGRDGREVALKVLLTGVDENPARLERFRREAIITAALEHPGIARALSAGVTTGRPWVSFELVDGARTFQDVFKTASVRRRAELIRDAARALGFAHKRSVIHRDVKPANLLVDRAGRVRVTDFGLAAARGLAPLTQTGSMLGTPLWMSPEQAGAHREALGPPSDVWGLGVILYEALTSTLPFDGATFVDLVTAITQASPRAPRSVTPGVDPALEAVCLRALQRDPARRYPDGDAMADDLDRALATPVAPPPGPAASAPAGRRALVFVHLALGVAGLAMIAGLLLRRPEKSAVVSTPPTPTPTTTTTTTPTSAAIIDESPEAAAQRALLVRARLADRDAQYELAHALLAGRGVAEDPADALCWLLQAAALGHGAAANEIGGLWNEGRGVPKDVRRAREWFKRAADLDDPSGMTNLATLMHAGLGGARDSLQAVTLFRAAAERGSREGCFRLAMAFDRGEGVEANHAEATRWLRRAEELGDPRAAKLLAEAATTVPEATPEVALATLRSAAEKGDARAAAELGGLYLDGARGVEKDLVQAESWLRRAVDGGATAAIVRLAAVLHAVTGERADAARRESLDLLRRGVDAGDLACMTNLGHAFASADGAARDDVQAAALFLRAAEGGETGGMRNLSLFLREGRGGLARDPVQAMTWAKRAAEGGRLDAMIMVADHLQNGLGCERDATEAARWLRLAAEKGDVEGMFLLGQQLLAGPKTGHPDGARWLLKAVQQNHVKAMVELARASLKGRGFARRAAAALSWAQRAAALGSPDGLVLLGRLLDDLGREVEARALFKTGAEQGVPVAMFELARLVERGRGGPVDLGLAASLRKRAADAGLLRALVDQAARETDPVAALALWRRTAEAGHPASMIELSRRVDATNHADARAWLERAAALGDTEAQLLLAADPRR